VVEILSCKCETLSSNSRTSQKKKKKREFCCCFVVVFFFNKELIQEILDAGKSQDMQGKPSSCRCRSHNCSSGLTQEQPMFQFKCKGRKWR
jgi:hypothetical protein